MAQQGSPEQQPMVVGLAAGASHSLALLRELRSCTSERAPLPASPSAPPARPRRCRRSTCRR